MAGRSAVPAVATQTVVLRVQLAAGSVAAVAGIALSSDQLHALTDVVIAAGVVTGLYVLLDRTTTMFMRGTPTPVGVADLPPVRTRRSTVLLAVTLLPLLYAAALAISLTFDTSSGGTLLGVILGQATISWRSRRHMLHLEQRTQATAYSPWGRAGRNPPIWLLEAPTPTPTSDTTGPRP